MHATPQTFYHGRAVALAIAFIWAASGCATGPGSTSRGAAQENAIASLEAEARRSPGDADAHYRLGNSLFDEGKITEALQAYLRAIEVDPEHVGAHCNSGLSYRLLGDMESAIESYTAAISIDPNDTTVLKNLAFALQSTGDRIGAVEHLTYLAKLQPEDVNVHTELAQLEFELEQYTESAAHYEKVIQLDARYADAHYNLGLCYYNLEKWDAAIRAWNTALDFESVRRSTYKGLAVVYWLQGDHEHAWEAVAECQRLGVLLDPDFILELQKDSGRTGPGGPGP